MGGSGERAPSQPLAGSPDRSLLLATVARDPAGPDQPERLIAALRAVLGAARVLVDRGDRLAYAYDATSERALPDAVALVRSADDVQAVMAIAARCGTPVVARGAASGLSGGAVPIAGGIVVALNGLTHTAIDPARRRALVQPGKVTLELATEAGRHGLIYAPDPASYRVSTLGGNVAENSGGPHCMSQGVTTQHVERLRVVSADGRLGWLPRTRDRRDGDLDLSGLVTGSEGTLAIVTDIEVRLVPRAEGQDTLLGAYPDMQSACSAVSAVIASGLLPTTLEVMDRATIEVVERFAPAGYPADAGAVLIVEVEGDTGERAEAAGRVRDLLTASGALAVRLARDQAERDLLWHGRRASYGAMARLASHLWVQDVTVPRPLLARMIGEVEAIARRHRLAIATVAHAGDGNLHPSIPYHPEDPDELRRMRAADHEILEACVALGGSITGEHGVGIDKLEALPLMYGEAELEAMWAVRRALDPEALLNPLKAVLSPAQARAAGRPPRPAPAPSEDEARVVEAVAAILDAGRRPLARGGGRRTALPGLGEAALDMTALVRPAVAVDADNLTLTVSAAASPAQIEAALASTGLGLRLSLGGATAGGLIARDPFRPSRAFGLSVRDSLLALSAVVLDPPRPVRFGRATTKNVAGYDMPRLWAGSWGRVGPIVSAVLRLWPRTDLATWAMRGSLAALWAQADAILAAPWRPALWALALEADAEGARLLVRVDGTRTKTLAEAGFAPCEPEADPIRTLEARLDALEIAAAAGRGALLHVWDLAPGAELALADEARQLPGVSLWGIPGLRLTLIAPMGEPSPALGRWVVRAREQGASVAVSATDPAYRALETPPEALWLDWTAALERGLGTTARTMREVER